MPRSHAYRALIRGISTLAMLIAFAASASGDVARASDWLGHAVVTADGQEVGTVRDFAIDERGTITYAVVSVGSFLIENNLIAVAPDALVLTDAGDGRLLLETDPEMLRQAQRFAMDGNWPARADVVRSTRSPATAARVATPAATEPPSARAPAPSGTATIMSPTKTAHLSANERYITEKSPEPPVKAVPADVPLAVVPGRSTTTADKPTTRFGHLDKDGDGVLNRSEFAHQMSPKDSYPRIDRNANGVIDPDEFEAFEQASQP